MRIFLLFIYLQIGALLAQSAFPITIDLVSVDAPGNQPDARTGRGAVPYFYQIGKYDVTAEHYCAFLNAVAKKDPYHLYDKYMLEDGYINEIHQIDHEGNYFYFVTPGRENLPITAVSFFNAARFCNWLENGQPNGQEDSSTTEDGSYLISNDSCIQRITAHWCLPTEDEWYKAAYYNKKDPTHYWNYATQSDDPPGNSTAEQDNQEDSLQKNANYCINKKPAAPFFVSSKDADLTPVGIFKASPGTFGTYDMSGNAGQWTTGIAIRRNDSFMIIRGGSRYDGMLWDTEIMKCRIDYLGTDIRTPEDIGCDIGFRVVQLNPLPEVTSLRAPFALKSKMNVPSENKVPSEDKALWECFY